jgi:hypothetical protein
MVDTAATVSSIFNEMRFELRIAPLPKALYAGLISLGAEVLICKFLEIFCAEIESPFADFRDRYGNIKTSVDKINPGAVEALHQL